MYDALYIDYRLSMGANLQRVCLCSHMFVYRTVLHVQCILACGLCYSQAVASKLRADDNLSRCDGDRVKSRSASLVNNASEVKEYKIGMYRCTRSRDQARIVQVTVCTFGTARLEHQASYTLSNHVSKHGEAQYHSLH